MQLEISRSGLCPTSIQHQFQHQCFYELNDLIKQNDFLDFFY